MVKYILTHYQDWQRIATDIVKVHRQFKKEVELHEKSGKDFVYAFKNVKVLINSNSFELAKLIIDSPLSPTQLQIMYNDFNQAVEFMINARRNFFCTLCSVSGQYGLQRNGKLMSFVWSSVLFDEKVCPVFAYNHLMHFHSYLSFFQRLQKFIEFLPYFLVLDNNARILTQNTQKDPSLPENPNGFDIA